jgi:hypothetical protein
MEFLSNDGRRLRTLADWRDHGGPVSAKAWAEGRSGRELARAWIEGDAPEQVVSLLASVPAFAGLLLDRGIVANGRHDLLVVGGAPSGPLVIGVQGKADEPFGERLDVWGTRASAEELDRLTTAFFGTTLDVDPLLAPLRFELLSGVAGAVTEGREREARQAVLLVHEFETPWSDDELHRRNAEDVEAFVSRLMPAAERAGDDRAWIAGPGLLAGDGEWLPESADVYVAKLVTSTR